MPFVNVDSNRIFYRMEGQIGAPVLVLSHSIGCDHGMWAQQVEALLPYFQILRYDIRGHGASDAPAGEYSIEQLGRDVIGLADTLKIQSFSFCGISLGGAIAQWLAANVPQRLNKIAIANSSPQFGPSANWDARRKAVVEGGMVTIVDQAMQRFFSPQTLHRQDVHAEAIRSVLLGTDPIGYSGCCAALRDFDGRNLLRKIETPTLVIAGNADVSTTWEGHGEILAREIAGARVVRLPAAHLSNIERPRSFNNALLNFILPQNATRDPLKEGFKVRREVLGDDHVDCSIASMTELSEDFQDFITSYAWGTIWTRPGLDHRTRRLLTLAISASLGRWEEFALHVRTGLAHELEPCDLKEVLLQTAIYAGVPAANTGFNVANEEIEKSKNKSDRPHGESAPRLSE